MGYWDNSCAFFFPRLEDKRIKCGNYSLEKFKECLDCTHFLTNCEAYMCIHPDGEKCLLQIGGVNHFQKEKG
jgi:hypothetical protein